MNGVGKAIATVVIIVGTVIDGAIIVDRYLTVGWTRGDVDTGGVDGAIAIRVAIDDINGDRGVFIGNGAVIISDRENIR